jgi:hypothetical protein
VFVPGLMLNKLFTIGSLRGVGQAGVPAGNFALGLRNDATRARGDTSRIDPSGNTLAAASS